MHAPGIQKRSLLAIPANLKIQGIRIHDVTSPQSLTPESPRDSIERAENKTGGGEQHESRQESKGTAGERPRAGRRKPGAQAEGRKQCIENGA